MTSAEITQQTYRFDMLRGSCRGVLTTATQTFGLFIAIRYFDAGFLAKSLIGAAPFMGMFLSLALVYYASTTGLRKSVWGAIPSALCGFCLLGAAFMNSLWTYGLMVALSFFALNSLTPFLTSIYNDNYPHDQRGAYFSKPLRLTVAVSVLFGFLASWVLDLDLSYYKPLFLP